MQPKNTVTNSEIGFSDEAWKDLKKLTKVDRLRVLKKIELLGSNSSNNVKSLTGNFGIYSRLRIGKIRVIFQKIPGENKILINYVGYRGSIYK